MSENKSEARFPPRVWVGKDYSSAVAGTWSCFKDKFHGVEMIPFQEHETLLQRERELRRGLLEALNTICKFAGQYLVPNPRWENRQQDAYMSGSENAFDQCIAIASDALAAYRASAKEKKDE